MWTCRWSGVGLLVWRRGALVLSWDCMAPGPLAPTPASTSRPLPSSRLAWGARSPAASWRRSSLSGRGSWPRGCRAFHDPLPLLHSRPASPHPSSSRCLPDLGYRIWHHWTSDASLITITYIHCFLDVDSYIVEVVMSRHMKKIENMYDAMLNPLPTFILNRHKRHGWVNSSAIQ